MDLKILHLDDDVTTLERFASVLKKHLTTAGHAVTIESFDKIEAFLPAIHSQRIPDIVLIDVHLEGQTISGVELARATRTHIPNVVLLMVSSTKDSMTIRACLRAGADDFVSKGAQSEELVTRLEEALEARRQPSDLEGSGNLEAVGETLASIKRRVPALLSSAVNCVYVDGESGTGKEVVANLFASCLPPKVPFVRLNCGAITPSLLMSELFGHVKGAFTGATSDKTGLLETAGGGWVFLDEVATLPLEAQVSLLRAIDSQCIRRVGATTERPVHFRVISATNEPLETLVQEGKFRKDLWQRLRETHITLPPLRARRQEISELIDFFLKSMRGGPYQLAPTVRETLTAYDWAQGNVRELRNVLRAMTEKSVGGLLTPKSIPERIWDTLDGQQESSQDTGSVLHEHNQIRVSWKGERPSLDHLTQLLLVEVVREEFRQSGPLSLRSLAKTLGIAKSTLSTKLKSLADENYISIVELNTLLKNGLGKAED